MVKLFDVEKSSGVYEDEQIGLSEFLLHEYPNFISPDEVNTVLLTLNQLDEETRLILSSLALDGLKKRIGGSIRTLQYLITRYEVNRQNAPMKPLRFDIDESERLKVEALITTLRDISGQLRD